MSKPIRLIVVLLICAVLLPAAGSAFLSASAAPLATAPSLGTAASYAVLAGSTVTNAGAVHRHRRSGCLARHRGHGLSSGRRSSRHDPRTVMRTRLQAQSDVTTAYNTLGAQACNTNLTGQDLGGHNAHRQPSYCFDYVGAVDGSPRISMPTATPVRSGFSRSWSTLTTASATCPWL